MRVFFDSNVFLKYLAGNGEAKELVDRVEAGAWEGFVNDVVVSETIYGYLRLALKVSRYKIGDYIAKHVGLVKELLEEDVYPVFAGFEHLPTSVGIDKTRRIHDHLQATTKRRPNSSHTQNPQLEHIASFDQDFDRIPWLKVVRKA